MTTSELKAILADTKLSLSIEEYITIYDLLRQKESK